MFVFQWHLLIIFSCFFINSCFLFVFVAVFLLLIYIAIIIPKKNVESLFVGFLEVCVPQKVTKPIEWGNKFYSSIQKRKQMKRTTIRDYKHSIGTFCLCLSVANCVYCLWFIWFVDYPRFLTCLNAKWSRSSNWNVVHI